MRYRVATMTARFVACVVLALPMACEDPPVRPRAPLKPRPPPTTPCPRDPVAKGKPVTMSEARVTADAVASAELCRQEREKQILDPRIDLPLRDYQVNATEVPCKMGEMCLYLFEYSFARDAPPFDLWKGHPLRFHVNVRQTDGVWELFPGK